MIDAAAIEARYAKGRMKHLSLVGTPIPAGVIIQQIVGHLVGPPIPEEAISKSKQWQTIHWQIVAFAETLDLPKDPLKINPQSGSSLLPSDQMKVDREFGSLFDAFRRWDFAIKWGCVETVDVMREPTRTTYAKIASRHGLSTDELKQRFAKFGYFEPCLTLTGYLHLLELEQKQKKLDQESKANLRLEQQRLRQANRRAKLSPAARIELRQKDRRRKQRQGVDAIVSKTENQPKSVQLEA